jgi:uncharacterized protein DUF4331
MSDHFSGPRATAGPPGDISDVYAFPSPDRPDHLVLVMNVLPLADLDAVFSDAIVYRFRLRPLTIEPDGPAFPYGPADSELIFDCSFDAPQSRDGDAPEQHGWCTSPSGARTGGRVHDDEGGRGDGLRIYAGLRSDPFFIDLPAILGSVENDRLAFPSPGENSLTNANVLGIVLEVEREQLLQRGGGPLFGVVGETVVAGKLPVRIDRFGRPEIKNVIMAPKKFDEVNRDLEIRDLYNLEDAFHLGREYRNAYRARLNANLAWFDRQDDKIDWAPGPDGAHPLTELLLADYMVVDVSKPFAQDGFLEIERAVLEGHAHETCGGRSLDHNMMATLYTVLVNAGNGPRISDGVEEPTVPASDVFPYLQPPNPVRPDDLPIMEFARRVGLVAGAH